MSMQWLRKLGLVVLLAVQAASSGLAASFSETKLLASDGTAGDRLGHAIAISGDTLVVSSCNHEDHAGAAYVFQRDAGGGHGWSEVKKLTASDSAPNAGFGQSVAIAGDTIVVGAHPESWIPGTGSAYIFERNQGGDDNWGEVQKLTASDATETNGFGHSVAIRGDTIAVGAYIDADAGAVYVFERGSGGCDDSWDEIKKITASDASAGDRFGQSVAMSDGTIAVGADGDSDMGEDSGSVYLFDRDHGGTDNWGQIKKLNSSEQGESDQFGWSVAIQGDRVMVGMWQDDDPFHRCGSAYIFERDFGGANNWGEIKRLQASDPTADEYFAWSVSVSTDRMVAGSASGSLFYFERNSGGVDNWGQVGELRASSASNGQLGREASISGDTIAVGGKHNGSNKGAAYVYEYNPPVPATAVWGCALLGALLLVSGVATQLGFLGRHVRAGVRSVRCSDRLDRDSL